MNKPVLGVIVGNRGFFPDHLCEAGRQTILQVLEEAGIEAIALTPEETPFGSVESLNDAQKCADLFKNRCGDTKRFFYFGVQRDPFDPINFHSVVGLHT